MTPEQFLSQTGPDDEDDVELVDPLASIADSLRTIAGHLTADAWVQEKADDKASENADLHAELRRAHEEADGLHARLEDIRALVKPSTSKLANSIRAAIDPQAPAEVGTHEPEREAVAAPLQGTRLTVQPTDDEAALPLVHEGPPANDAPVEAWREYARTVDPTSLKPGVLGWIDHANRSQIRTALGIPQPVSSAEVIDHG